MTTEPTDADLQEKLETIESDIRNVLKMPARPLVPLTEAGGNSSGTFAEIVHTPPPLPVDEVGHMAADAVRKVYETTAKHVESMGDEVKDRIVSLGAALKEAEVDLQALADAAQAIRAKGAAVEALVEAAAGTSKAIRDLAADFRTRVSS